MTTILGGNFSVTVLILWAERMKRQIQDTYTKPFSPRGRGNAPIPLLSTNTHAPCFAVLKYNPLGPVQACLDGMLAKARLPVGGGFLLTLVPELRSRFRGKGFSDSRCNNVEGGSAFHVATVGLVYMQKSSVAMQIQRP